MAILALTLSLSACSARPDPFTVSSRDYVIEIELPPPGPFDGQPMLRPNKNCGSHWTMRWSDMDFSLSPGQNGYLNIRAEQRSGSVYVAPQTAPLAWKGSVKVDAEFPDAVHAAMVELVDKTKMTPPLCAAIGHSQQAEFHSVVALHKAPRAAGFGEVFFYPEEAEAPGP